MSCYLPAIISGTQEDKREDLGFIVCAKLYEQWYFDLSADLLRKSLAITDMSQHQLHPFELPPSGTRAILTLINQCLTRKGTSAVTNPDTQTGQMLWGIVTQTNVDHAELIWEEFTQGIQTFSHTKQFGSAIKKKKREKEKVMMLHMEKQAIKLSDPAFLHKGKPCNRRTSSSFPESICQRRKELRISLSLLGVIKLLMIQQLDPLLNLKMTHQRKWIHESSSTSDSNRTESKTEAAALKVSKIQDPDPMQEDQTRSNSGKLHVSLAGPNPEHMDDEFLATAYPKVDDNLKLITDERVIDDNPESHSGSMSSMKNLDDTYNFGDQFLYDKPTEDDQEKSKVREESDSILPDPINQQ
ncbi:hypothetical protein Tco_0792718 [Tanacetum coccineum]